jgi:diguanylate cyclase (GGDEF)-like protein
MIRRPVRTVAWTLALVATGLAAGGAVILVANASVAPIEDRASSLADSSLPAGAALQATATAGAVSQRLFLEAIAASEPATRASTVERAQRAGREGDAAWARYLRLAGESAGERRLQRQYEAGREASQKAGATLFGSTPADPTYAANLSAEQGSSARMQKILDELDGRFYEPASLSDARAAVAGVADARRNVLVAFGAALLVFLGAGVVILRRAVRFERVETLRARARAIDARQADLETRLQRGLEMESTEEGTYDVIRQAFGVVAPDRAVELLVADSSRAHFHQVISTAEDGRAACQVGAPSECPAASSGQTRVFGDSRNLDTCPYLRDHQESVWATCVPVSIAGRTNGVIHVEDSTGVPADESLATEFELVARKAGERMGVLRVLARTEAQAQVDPLTGLPNRRTLEQRTHELLESDMVFVVAFADLDHFKDLNDLHGHDTGDRALRLFARVLRDSVRPRDIPARYGGEEFVVVLPDCSIVDARVVAERIRTQLAAALEGGSVPDFTVSVGLAAAEPGEAISEVIDRADAALLKAKQLGRDRVLAAGEIFDTNSVDAVGDTPEPPTQWDPETSTALGR